MVWFKLDDGFCTHDKTMELLELEGGLEAVGLWTICAAMVSRPKDADGTFTARQGRRMCDMDAANFDRLAALLVKVGLWERDGDIVSYHDWYDYRDKKHNRTDEDRRKDCERQAKRRAKLAADAMSRDVTDRDRASHVCDESVTKHPVPFRSDPSSTDPSRADTPTPPAGGECVSDPATDVLESKPGSRRKPKAKPAGELVPLQVAIDGAWRETHGGVALMTTSARDAERLRSLWAWAQASRPDDPLALVVESWMRAIGELDGQVNSPWHVYAAHPEVFVGPKKKRHGNGSRSSAGWMKDAKAGEFTNGAVDVFDLIDAENRSAS